MHSHTPTARLPLIRHASVVMILALMAAALSTPAPVSAATGPLCYVDWTAPALGDGDAWATAFTDLQSAIADLACTEIWVAAGTYKPDGATPGLSSLTFSLRSGLQIYGGFTGIEVTRGERDPAANVTVLSGEIGAAGATDNSWHVVTASGVDNTAVLDGFTITRGFADLAGNDSLGAGIYNNDGAPYLLQLIIYDNYAAGGGGGLYNQSTFPAPTLIDVTFDANTTDLFGGGMYNNSSSPILMRLTFTGNEAGNDGGAMANVTNAPTLTNVTFQGNSATDDGGAIFNTASDMAMTNVTFSGNTATGDGGAMFSELFSDPVVYDSIFWRSADDIFVDSGDSTTTIVDSIVYNGCPADATCTNVINADPKLGPLQNNGGYTMTMAIQGGSAALDAGGDNSSCATEDQRVVNRPQGAGCDIGAFESYICYVDDSAVGAEDGTSWADAHTSLQPPLADEICSQIWVADGLYTPGANETDTFSPSPGVQLYGGFAGTEASVAQRVPGMHPAILSGDLDDDDTTADGVVLDYLDIVGDNSDHVLKLDGTTSVIDSGTIIDGFTITGGQADAGGYPGFVGGGMYCDGNGGMCSPLLRNLTFSGNAADGNGGALFNEGFEGVASPWLAGVTFRGNGAVGGGAIYNNGVDGVSSPLLTNVTIHGNTAGVGGAGGGGMYNNGIAGGNSSPVLNHVTFNNNNANAGGAMFNSGTGGTSAPILTNSILWGNSASGGPSHEMYNSNASPTIHYSVVDGGDAGIVNGTPWASGIGNVLESPELGPLTYNGGYTDTLALAAESSALEIASNGGCQATDQRGVARPQGAGCDRGAYERIPAPADFDGSYASDVVLFRVGAWLFYDYDTGLGLPSIWTGNPGGACVPAPMDYDGDGSKEFTLLCGPAWHFYNDNGSYNKGIWVGAASGVPVPADYDGDGTDDVVLWQTGAWQAYDFATGAYLPGSSVWTGNPGGNGVPAPMDHDGDGPADLTILSGGAWHFYNANGSYNKGIWVGNVAGQLPVPGDYYGDTTDDVMVFRAGAWLPYDFTTGAFLAGQSVWTGNPAPPAGGGATKPAPIDYDGDGTLDFTFFGGGPWHFYNDNGTYNKGIWVGKNVADVPISRRHLP